MGDANIEFMFSYQFDGKSWCGSVWADTWEEAEMKLRAMSKGRIDGRVVDKIPAGAVCPSCGQGVPNNGD